MAPVKKTTRRTGQVAKATAGTDAIEVKVTIAQRHEMGALLKFALERKHAERRRIYFFDTPKLALFKKGVVLRARDIEGSEFDSTVKIRPVDPKKIPAKWHKKSGFKVEADAVGKKMIRSASYTIPQGDKEVDEVASGARPIEKLFSEEQEGFLADMSPVEVDFEKLVVLGPVAALRWKFEHSGIPYALCVEEWRIPGGRNVIETSIKATREGAAAALAGLEGFLDELGLASDAVPQTKTRVALEYFAGRN